MSKWLVLLHMFNGTKNCSINRSEKLYINRENGALFKGNRPSEDRK